MDIKIETMSEGYDMGYKVCTFTWHIESDTLQWPVSAHMPVVYQYYSGLEIKILSREPNSSSEAT